MRPLPVLPQHHSKQSPACSISCTCSRAIASGPCRSPRRMAETIAVPKQSDFMFPSPRKEGKIPLSARSFVSLTLPSKCVPHNGLVVGDSYPRSRRGGGSVVIAAAISKGRGISRPGTATACLHRCKHSGSPLAQRLIRALFKLRRTHVAKGGMHPCPVIPEHPRDHFILGLANGLETPAVQPFHFQ